MGVEGPTDNIEIELLRNRQVKNFLAVTLLAIGAPMLLMGDEVRRTQQGNNNAYCQDNEISWFDWDLLVKHADTLRFVKQLVRLRFRTMREHLEINLSLNELLRQARIAWHGVRAFQPDWGPDSHTLAFTVESLTGRIWFYIVLNAYWEPLEFELPPVPQGAGSGWRRVIDTSCASPDDILDVPETPVVEAATYQAQPRSVVLLAVEIP